MPTINLKEYADTRKISYDAVRKQIQRYRDILGENIIKQGKNLLLNEKAVEILDSKQKKSVKILEPSQIIEQLREENSALKDKIISLQDELLVLEKKLINALEAKQRKKFSFLFNR